MSLTAGAARARDHFRHHGAEQKEIERAGKEPFGAIPKGPLQIFISTNQQKLHLYSDGTHIADAPVATGVPSHPTPFGVFNVIQKERFHRSNKYSNAPMPFMQRITWSGVALHEGKGLGRPASHGCIRMPHDFAVRLYGLTRLGAAVIIARGELAPLDFADAHLFVHKDRAPDQAAGASELKTAQSGDRGNSDDAAAPVPASLKDDPATAAGAATAADHAPIAIFISRKNRRIYVRQHFAPLFDAAVTIAPADQPLGTHLFTAMDYRDGNSAFRWTVVSLPGDPPRGSDAVADDDDGGRRHHHKGHRVAGSSAGPLPDPPPPATPQEALSRIEIPAAVAERISAMIVPGSSLIISDQGLGDETGAGTDFVVVAR